ncbi:hypothetical protein A3C91_01285 [Candidatus Azambacteria bacterium RIFCSPHIGHO2_02_FULL_52_12]|uniref:SHSP domain-containing protein n=1 Tax=Candidatus Azambacteria bacterium RIFCSPLOWO2_01_FULL_46_25 TaxID=1797298 RepID=A0A1F5BV82_9BACT|nr:MAG: hypothetical protein A3C91_01285 [Candidatus Azambacteria bacterium RIFCSPHIGHO2_02_FULL_52_12]OGD34522.1 MAG: hypothetical protein A2988_03345 [Candidatus Azambacteria bacterium RIFCSPLOWO2_01_FULL_46_25]OGD36396.1 MAG: hypothetical protein A2850_01845 [Candidatus Azambacteria bacterium RIFCSPHIGHO2_01_FULL_51_74]
METESFFDKLAGAQADPVPQKQGKSKEWLSESEGQLPLDVYQTTTDVVIKSTVAGVRASDIDVSVTNDILTIKGVRVKDEEVNRSDYYYQECYWGPFSRSVILPASVKTDQIKASLKNGVLTVRLPKLEKSATQKVSITSA